ncbi:hypothetical protein ACTDI4_11720 [Mesorhizobium sp. PUT5]|uniref:hypothetical protein n=1 Tax=Mesorhizobium sp. PUT5 TaxID=3454629 RepID=UPI003FA44491
MINDIRVMSVELCSGSSNRLAFCKIYVNGVVVSNIDVHNNTNGTLSIGVPKLWEPGAPPGKRKASVHFSDGVFGDVQRAAIQAYRTLAGDGASVPATHSQPAADEDDDAGLKRAIGETMERAGL